MVAVTLVKMMEVSAYEIIEVVPMRHAFMSTGRTVSVSLIVTFTGMIGCAGTWIEVTH